MADFDQTFPAPLAEMLSQEFDYNEGNGMDFEPYDQFQPASENADWIRAWTGNKSLDGREYRIFGQDGTGGYAMFWLVREGVELLEQPIVFFDSEGAVGPIARNFGELCWILAGGIGPYEALSYGGRGKRETNDEFTALAQKYAPGKQQAPEKLVEAAKAEFPSFEADIRALCK